MLSRSLILAYGGLSYAIGLGGLVLFILYTGGWEFLPFHIDSSEPPSVVVAVSINIGLMLLTGLQHSGMARPRFKKAWTKVVPPAAERSTYVLLSGLVFILICFQWQAIAGSLWTIENQFGRSVVTSVQLFGWGLAVASTFLINHFELFGVQQTYFYYVGKPEPKPSFTDRFLYRFVRHPLQLGVLIGIWFAPTMTMTHLMLSIMMTLYIFVGLYFEENDLVATLGTEYENYQKRVRMLLPVPKRNRAG